MKPTFEIGLLNEVLFAETDDVHLHFEIYSCEHRILFNNHLAIPMLQLKT